MAVSTPAPSGRRARAKDDTGLALLFIAPALVGFLVFLLWPTLRASTSASRASTC